MSSTLCFHPLSCVPLHQGGPCGGGKPECYRRQQCPSTAPALQEHQLREAQEDSARRAGEEAAADLREREHQLVVALADAQASLATVSRKHQDAQDKLLEFQQRKEDSAAGAEADAELANEELDRAKMQCAPEACRPADPQ